MMIYPAIDLAQGKCVRLLQGRRSDQTVYGERPAELALQWQEQGARYLHVVDLDGAVEGDSKNRAAVREILCQVKIPVQVGGGIRTGEAIKAILNEGIARVILGTAAIENPRLVEDALNQWGADRIVVGMDARDGHLAVRGWVEQTKVTACDLALVMRQKGIRTFVVTDISRDGMLTGPNINALREMGSLLGNGVIASGGISNLFDVKAVAALKDSGVEGMIIGKALYEGRFTLAEAIRISEGKKK